MSDYPDLSSKLTAPAKKSLFERQKAEAEAKRAREKAETAAVLEDFVKSFEDDGGRPAPTGARGPPAGGAGKRHFTSSGLKSGPGSLGPAPTSKSGPGSLGPAFGRKRAFDDYSDRPERGGVFSFQDGQKPRLQDEDVEDERAAAKPTLHLSSMPPGTSAAVIQGLLAHTTLAVDHVRILPPVLPSGPVTERKSSSAIVTLAAETPATDIDTVVSQLQNRYLGFGFNLSISRHLSSAAVGSANLATGSSSTLPFGAKPISQHASLSRAPPPGQRFAPPTSYTSSVPYSKESRTQVTVQPPSELKQLKLIHKMLEALLTYGPEFEALLMSRPEIQEDEKWAWLWDSRSSGGVYYRWRLWEILTNASGRRRSHGHNPEALFEGQSLWVPPTDLLRFEYTTRLEEFVSDEDYNSSDEEDDEGGLARRYNDHNATMVVNDDANSGMGYLDPLAKTKLMHLLTRLPETSSKLRRGDVARVTAFAIEHAGAGGDEVAMLVTQNVVKPFHKTEEEDATTGSLVGLYVISDLLSSSASAGVRHAWRYRTLFENALRKQQVFEKLGRAEKDHKWGKLKAEKWKRSVQALLSLWESWSVFPQSAHEEFTDKFLNPPLSAEEKKQIEEDETRKVDEEKMRTKSTTKWRSIQDAENSDVAMRDADSNMDLDGSAMKDDSDDDIDGVTLPDSSDEELPEAPPPESATNTRQPLAEQQEPSTSEMPLATPKAGAFSLPSSRRQRPRAVDMFADDSD